MSEDLFLEILCTLQDAEAYGHGTEGDGVAYLLRRAALLERMAAALPGVGWIASDARDRAERAAIAEASL